MLRWEDSRRKVARDKRLAAEAVNENIRQRARQSSWMMARAPNILTVGRIPMIGEKVVLVVGETSDVAVVLDLSEGEVLTGIPTIVELATNHLTITKARINTSILEFDEGHIGRHIGIGKAVQFTVSEQKVTGSPYTVVITAQTNSIPSQTKKQGVAFIVASGRTRSSCNTRE